MSQNEGSTVDSEETVIRRADRRPVPVTAAVAMSWAGATATIAFGVLFLFLASDDGFLREYGNRVDSSGGQGALVTQVRITGVVMIGWGALIAVVAALAAGRHNWARIALTAMAVIYVGTAFVGPFASGAVGLPYAAYVIACVALLWTRPARTWFSAAEIAGPAGYRQRLPKLR